MVRLPEKHGPAVKLLAGQKSLPGGMCLPDGKLLPAMKLLAGEKFLSCQTQGQRDCL